MKRHLLGGLFTATALVGTVLVQEEKKRKDNGLPTLKDKAKEMLDIIKSDLFDSKEE